MMTPGRKLVSLLPLVMVLLVGVVLGGTGCHRQKVHAAAPPPAAQMPAPNPVPMPTTAPPETTPVPPVQVAPANPPPEMPAPKPVTPRPHVNPAPSPTPETPPAPRPVPPQLRPRVTPAEAAEYKRKTTDAITEAEKNLQRAYGRELSQEQRDLVEKIRGFLTQAREAGDAGDWGRALNLAEKARLLSHELVSSS